MGYTHGTTWTDEKIEKEIMKVVEDLLRYSETAFGNRFEIEAISDIFENTGLHSVQPSTRHPYDLIVDNSVKIDVKASKEFTNNCNSKAFTFNLEKRVPKNPAGIWGESV